MALNYNLVNTMVQERYLPGFADNIYDECALFFTLQMDNQVVIQGGERITEGVLYGKNLARGTFAGFDTLDVTPQDTRNRIRHEWANYYVSIAVSQDDEDKISGVDAVGDLLEQSMREAQMSMKDQLGADLYQGLDANGITGLESAIASSNTYGAIDGSSYTWWNSTVDSTAHTKANMRTATHASYCWTLLGNAFAATAHGGSKPNLVVTTHAVFNIFESVAIAQQKFEQNNRRTESLAQNGFSVLQYRGVPIVADEYCPANKLYVLNTKYLKLFTHSRSSQKGFRFSGYKEPTNQLGRVGQLSWKGQLGINNRRMFYKFASLGAS